MSSRLSRRQTRHRTFGPLAELYSPPRHNSSVHTRKTLLKAWSSFRDLGRAARFAAAQFSGLVAAQARVEELFAQEKAAVDS